jgi:serine/threonine protein kinase
MKTRKYKSFRRRLGKRTNHTRRKQGGKVIGSGGYGCVFRPALRCNGTRKRASKTISKLMLNKYVKREYMEITKYLPILRKIPNYKNYFIIEGANICQPAQLTQSDLMNFDTKCKVLRKRDINAKNINNNLDKISSINLQDGGVELGTYIYSGLSLDGMNDLNDRMIQLLVNGILPMNKSHIYHADIKETNIVVDVDGKYVRLIDWGLSMYTTSDKHIPSVLRDKPLQYNLPFSIILFNDTFKTMYSAFLKTTATTTTTNDLDNNSIARFLKGYIEKWNKTRGKGHIETITSIWRDITGKQNIQEGIIIPYLTAILLEYTRNGQFDTIGYFKNVFLKQLDLWGFIICYSAFLETGYKNEKINNLIINYLYKKPTENINIDELVRDLRNIF